MLVRFTGRFAHVRVHHKRPYPMPCETGIHGQTTAVFSGKLLENYSKTLSRGIYFPKTVQKSNDPAGRTAVVRSRVTEGEREF